MVEFSFTYSTHTGNSIRNLVNLLYSRGKVISKATGGNFKASAGLVEALKDENIKTYEKARQVIEVYIAEHEDALSGDEFTPVEVIFNGFPDAELPGKIRAFGSLARAMNQQAIAQKRIQARIVDDANEKYIFRIWMVRIGLSGDAYRETRRYLLKNLTGNVAFRVPINLKLDEKG